MNQLVQYRREFHYFPDIGWREFRTSARIAEILTEMGYDVELIDEKSIGEPERLDANTVRAEMNRAIQQGANPSFVEQTKGLPGVMAVLDSGRLGPVTAFRFDIDALPYPEKGEEGFRPFEDIFPPVRTLCMLADMTDTWQLDWERRKNFSRGKMSFVAKLSSFFNWQKRAFMAHNQL